MTPEVDHRPDCAVPMVREFISTRGDTLRKCRNCGQFAIVVDEPSPPPRKLRALRVIPCAGDCGVTMAHPSPRAAVRYCGACAEQRRTAEARRARRDARRRQAQSEPWGWIA